MTVSSLTVWACANPAAVAPAVRAIRAVINRARMSFSIVGPALTPRPLRGAPERGFQRRALGEVPPRQKAAERLGGVVRRARPLVRRPLGDARDIGVEDRIALQV